MKIELCQQIFEKYSNIKFHEKLSRGAELLHATGRTDRRTDMTKLIIACRKFSNAPKSRMR